MPPQNLNMVKRWFLHSVRWFLPVLFISYLASITFFAHIHVVDGMTIVHSHPFKKGAAHQHTAVELLLVHFLSHLTTDGAAVVFALCLFIPFLLFLLPLPALRARYYCPYYGVVGLRAPPAVRFSNQ